MLQLERLSFRGATSYGGRARNQTGEAVMLDQETRWIVLAVIGLLIVLGLGAFAYLAQ